MAVGSFQPVPEINLAKIRRALISVSDKTNLKELCSFLASIDCEMIGTSSTCKAILEYGFPCTSADSLTQFPEMLGGRVKTLHPNIFGAILGRPQLPADQNDLTKFNIKPFDLVVCNLYPFQEIAEKNLSPDEMVDYIDIGGVSLLRAAAKNHSSVNILCDAEDYSHFIKTIQLNGNLSPLALRRELAIKALAETASYDELISATLMQKFALTQTLPSHLGPVRRKNIENIKNLPDSVNLTLSKIQPLRYGENPHQKAAFYKLSDIDAKNFCSLAQMKCFHGKELSYNNMLDIEHAVRLTKEFSNSPNGLHAAIIVKHNTPCGVGTSTHSITEAYTRAFEGDPVSPFGGIVCTTTKVTTELAHKLSETFLEVVIAPEFDEQAQELLQKKKNLRLVTYNAQFPLVNDLIFTHVQGGFLAQSANNLVLDLNKVTYPTLIKPSQEIMKSFQFAMTVAKHVRSNAIVVANDTQTISIAGGFTNRVDAVELALSKAKLSLNQAVLASDAFFPFPDSIELIKNSGIKNIVQPGGSVQDAEVIKACDKYGLCMIFTGNRHFKH